MPQLVETEQEWFLRHGGRESGVRLPSTDVVVFPTGAYIKDRMGYYEPPTDPWERLALQHARATELCKRATGAYEKTRTGLLQLARLSAQYDRYFPPTEQDKAALRELKKVAEQCREELAAIDAQLDESPNRQFRKHLQEEREARVVAARKAESDILNI